MSGIFLSALFLLAADQPPPAAAAPATAEPTVTVTAQVKAEEAPMVCKYEKETGSRVKRVKVCHRADEKPGEQSTALQRELSKNGDYVEPSGTFGN